MGYDMIHMTVPTRHDPHDMIHVTVPTLQGRLLVAVESNRAL